jgi:hypothetical protein
MAKKRKRKRKRRRVRDENEPMTPEALLIHRELQALRAAGLTRKRKPSTLARTNGRAKGRKNHAWVADRFHKLEESRREVAPSARAGNRRDEGPVEGSSAARTRSDRCS